MRQLSAFNNVTLDGYFAGKNGDTSWAKGNRDAEFNEGRTMFDGIEDKLNLKLTRTWTFSNGNVLLCYAPMA
jgi:hypothetical protein